MSSSTRGGAAYRSGDRTSGRARYEYIISSGSLQGMLAHAPTGWLHPVPLRDTVFLSPSLCLSLSAPCLSFSLPLCLPLPEASASVLCANYTCANQPTSNEPRPVALSVGRVEPLLSSQPGGWVERGAAHSLALFSLGVSPRASLCLITRRR